MKDERACKTFLGSRVLVEKDSRTELPFKKPDEPYPAWKVLKKFIGQDLTKVSMPVFMNEPLSALQR